MSDCSVVVGKKECKEQVSLVAHLSVKFLKDFEEGEVFLEKAICGRVHIRKSPMVVAKAVRSRMVSARDAWSYPEKISSSVTRWPIARSAAYSSALG